MQVREQVRPLRLFQGYGIEIEYMLVDRETLDILPVVDQVLQAAAGAPVSEITQGPVGWSNELALHVIELKSNGPVARLCGLEQELQQAVGRVNAIAADLGGCLMPTGMHPWMDPTREARMWIYACKEIYAAYDRIFGCRGHGWSNVQSTHINLPFQGDEEFARLHSALRLVLPLVPAMAASSPVCEGRLTGVRDTRLTAYQTNQQLIPLVAGRVVPECVNSQREYEECILQPMYRAIAPHDPAGTLQHEWLNSRGAIARFERGTIELRLLDTQECPAADMAIAGLLCAVIKSLVEERDASLAHQQRVVTRRLAAILQQCMRDAESACVDDSGYAQLFGYACRGPWRAGDLVHWLADRHAQDMGSAAAALSAVLDRGTLATRIMRALGDDTRRQALQGVYRQLCDCLAQGRVFHA